MDKLDLRKQLKQLYQPSAKKVEVVDVPPLLFAMIDGAIEPGSEPGMSPAFAEALQALYGITYTLKFMCKQRAENPIDYTVMGLEALWWVEDGRFDITVKDNWFWQAMILQPDFITPEMFAEAVAQVRKKRGDSPSLGQAAPGALARRAGHADHAHWPVQRGTGHQGKDGRFRPGERLPIARQAP